MPNCTRWPHMPPHCGCPVEVAPTAASPRPTKPKGKK